MQMTQTPPQLATFLPIAEEFKFAFDSQQSFHSELTLFRGSSTFDCFMIIYPVKDDKLDLRIVRYEKRYASEPFGADVDRVTRQPLFFGLVDAFDEAGIRAILKATVPAK